MSWFKDDVLPILRHFAGTFIAAVTMFFAAIGLSFVERWCRNNKIDEDICVGIHAVSFIIFSLDGILVCGILAITVLRMLSRTWRNER